MDNVYDTIIIGAGAAGCSAAIYATRFNLKTLLISGPMPGGLITWGSEVENYPGFVSITGGELGQKFIDHAKALGAEYVVDVVKEVNSAEDLIKVKTDSNEYNAKTVILTTGTHHKKLGIPGEDEFLGKGVSYCTTCDGYFFKDKVVAIVGGGNSAVEGANDLAQVASKVHLIYRGDIEADPAYIDLMRKNPKIIEVPLTNVTEIKGDTGVRELILDRPFNGLNSLKVEGVFIEIGYIPSNDLAFKMGLTMNQYGYVMVDRGMGTNIKGIFVAGDLNNASNNFHQQVTAAAEGSIAAQSAYRYIKGVDYIIE